MKDLSEKLDSMTSQSFIGWTESEKNGYMTAVSTIREFMMNEEPKQNRCLLDFACNSDNCVHYSQGKNDFCKYRQANKCTSKVAQNNAMFVSLENQGIITPAMKHADELLEALKNILADMNGGKKKCGHDFNCVCPVSTAKQAIQKAEGQDLSSCECQSWARTDMTFADLGKLQDHHPECKHNEQDWISCDDSMPPEDYDYSCMIKIGDDFESLSDGGSVYDSCLCNDPVYWKPLPKESE